MIKLLQVLVLLLAFAGVAPLASQTGAANQLSSITLYSPLRTVASGKISHDHRRALFSFVSGTYSSEGNCDFSYGQVYIGSDLDWFLLNVASSNRSVIKDLGEHGWSDHLEVSVLAPLPSLKAGEQRQLTIDASGKDGADGLPGADGDAQRDNLHASSAGQIKRGAVRDDSTRFELPANLQPVPGWRPRTKKVETQPLMVKAVGNHMYLFRLVDAYTDSYFLLHVDSIVSGDNCTISWKQISAPK